jgi:transcription elongation GreA/GreB family factor
MIALSIALLENLDSSFLPVSVFFMDKADLLAQLNAHLQATVRDARQAMEAASVEAREGATPAEKREDSRVALEQSGLARGQQVRLNRALADVALLEGFAPKRTTQKRNAPIELGSIVEVESDDVGRTLFLAPVGAGVELTGPGGDGYLSVVTPSSPLGRAVLGKSLGDVVELVVGGEKREWTISFVD